MKTIPTFLVQLDLFGFERKTWELLLMWVFLCQLQCLEFVSNLWLILEFCVLQVLFQSEGNSLTFGPFFTVPGYDFWNADTSEGFSFLLKSCFTPCFLPPQPCMWSVWGVWCLNCSFFHDLEELKICFDLYIIMVVYFKTKKLCWWFSLWWSAPLQKLKLGWKFIFSSNLSTDYFKSSPSVGKGGF